MLPRCFPRLRFALLLAGFWVSLFSARAQALTFDLALLAGVQTLVDQTDVYDLAVDVTGNMYITGAFSGTVHFGSSILTTTNNIGSEAFVAKINAQGAVLWAVQSRSSSAGDAYGQGLVLDAAGNVYVTGGFAGSTATFGSVTLANPQSGGNSQDIFVARLDGNGAWQWAVGAGGAGGLDGSTDIALDPAGDLYITGLYRDQARFGTTVLANANAPRSDCFVARLDIQGTWRWAVSAGGALDESGAAITVYGGRVYLAGNTSSPTMRLGALTLSGPTGFVAQLDAAGAFRWVTTSGSGYTRGSGGTGVNAGNRTQSLAMDGAGHLYYTGSFTGTANFGGTTRTSTTFGFSDGFVARLDTTGTYRWLVQIGGPGKEEGSRIATDSRGEVYVTGTYSSAAYSFGSTTLPSPNANNHVFVANISPAGNWRWALPATIVSPGITTYNTSNALALGPGATPHIGGEFSSAIGFGNGLSLQGQYAGTAFLARVQPLPSLVVAGDSLLCNGGQLTLTATVTGAAIAYQWNTGATTAAITVAQPGNYSVTVTFRGGATLTARYQVRAFAPTVTIAGGSGRLCQGGSIQLLATAPGTPALQWSTGATTARVAITQPGTYSVTARYGAGCAATAQVTITANTLEITGRRQLCPGQSAVLTAVGTGTAITAYRWNTGATTPTLQVGQMGIYSVTATFADGCVSTVQHRVGPPVATVASVSGDTLLCPRTSLQLTALNPDALTYQWNTGATTPTIAVATAGYYRVVLTYAGGCSSRDSLQVRDAPLTPAFSLGADTTLCLAGQLVLQAPALGGTGASYRWSDGSTGPELLVREAGLYSLKVQTRCDSRTVYRRVDYASCLLIPNVITPNGDGHNDRFVVIGLTQGPWALALYTRWGQAVYTTAAYQHDWGAQAAPGIYYYVLWQGATRYKGVLEVIR